MFIEKSFDWGQTWTIHRYFSADCALDFPEAHIGELILSSSFFYILYLQGVPRSLNESVCQGRYSRITPSTNGEVKYDSI